MGLMFPGIMITSSLSGEGGDTEAGQAQGRPLPLEQTTEMLAQTYITPLNDH